MRVLRNWSISAVVVFAVLISAAAPGYGAQKIDPLLAIMTRPGADLQGARSKGLVKSAPGTAEPVVSTLIKFEGNLSGVESYGGTVRSIIGDVATVDIPVSAVSQIAALPNVTFIEAARPVKPLLDVSMPATGASALRTGTAPSWTGNTGRNVIIGIVDTGIDLTHKDFKDSGSKTRILTLWDQNTPGTHPTGYTYGNECTKAVIDAGTCSQTDTYGHGTHVAGIAAGNGSATGNGKAAYRYVGMAPEADIMLVNTDFTTTGILDGIAYIEAKAAALGRPCVINLSLGGQFDPHDGTSAFAQALDAASGTGKVIVAAAGNEAQDDIHGSGTLATGATLTVGLTIPASSPGEMLDIWYAGGDQMNITVNHGAERTNVVSPGTANSVTQLSCGKVTISSSGINASNGDREIVVLFENGTNTLCSGAWSFTLSAIGTITNGRFDAWSGLDSSYMTFADHVDTSITIGDTGSATKPISVASYNTKDQWDSLDGNTYAYYTAITLGGISPFSSLGPRRSCSIPANCPAIQKPEIAAPGMGIMSSLSAQSQNATIEYKDPDGVHILEQGTSMATPHVTGAVALILQADPTLTSDQVKNYIFTNAATDTYTGAVPNNTWGNGKLDAYTAFTATLNPAPAAPANFAVGTPGDGYVPFTWTKNTELDLDGYNLYRVPQSGGAYTKANATLISYKANSYNDISGQNSTPYNYKLRAVDTKGQESPDSSIVSATTTSTNPPPAAPGGLSASATATATLTLSWNPDTEPDLAGFNLYRSTTAGSGFTKINSSLIPNTSTSYVNASLTIGTTYYYVLRAVDGAAQESGNSNQASGTAQTISSGGGGTPTPGGSNPRNGGGGGGGGCFIATAAYGSYLDAHVKTLRDFRDQVLLQSDYGKAFVSLYYAWSPPIAAVIAESPALRFIARLALTPVVLAVEHPRFALVLFLSALLALGVTIGKRRRGFQDERRS